MTSDPETGSQNLKMAEMESEISRLRKQLAESLLQQKEVEEQKSFYKLVADFTLDWEIWLHPGGSFAWCSSSCFSLTGYTSEQILHTTSFIDLLVMEYDRRNFSDYLSNSLNLTIINQSFEFRIITRTRQIRWCEIKSGAVYDPQGKYLGIRASVRDINRLKSAYGQIREMDSQKQLDLKIKSRLKTDLESKDRELVDSLLQLSKKNEVISFLIKNLGKSLQTSPGEMKKRITELLETVSKLDKTPFNWQKFELQIEANHPGFFDRLQALHHRLTRNEKRLCAFLRLSLSSKEIAGLLDIESASVEIARVRLRKKLKVGSNERLTQYLSSI
jgi:PAS domain S-box-containing protein